MDSQPILFANLVYVDNHPLVFPVAATTTRAHIVSDLTPGAKDIHYIGGDRFVNQTYSRSPLKANISELWVYSGVITEGIINEDKPIKKATRAEWQQSLIRRRR
jgi:hypothetical protein